MEAWSKPIGLRLRAGDEELLRKVCDDRGENLSSFVRRCIRKELAGLSYYSEDTKKSLGVKPTNAAPEEDA